MNKDRIAENFLPNVERGEKIVVYQMLTRLFGNKQSANIPFGTIEENGVGKFSDIDDHALSSIADLGITHIWYTGVIEHALLTDYRKYGIPLDDADVVKGRAGSPYAIKDYYDVNPDLADQVEIRMTEFGSLIDRTHQHQLKVIIDFVPNHVARRYQSDAKPAGTKDLGEEDDPELAFYPMNNFYYLPGESFQVPDGYNPLGSLHDHPTKDHHFEEIPAKVSGNNVFKGKPDINDWFETVKLNYGIEYGNTEKKHFQPVPDTWIKMKDILFFWAKKDIDGFRCDMAEMVPVEFWKWVIPQVKSINKEILFIAEIYNPDQYRNYLSTGKFDYLYDKVQLYDTLKQIIQGKGKTSHITEVWKSLKDMNPRMLRFLENHDEQRIASSFFAGDPFKATPAMAVSGFLSSGPVMIYFGQEVGETGSGIAGFSGEDGRTTIYDYWGVPSHQKWMNDGKFDGGKLNGREKDLRNIYKRILNICKSHPAIREGHFFDLHAYNSYLDNTGNESIYYFLRFTGDKHLLILLNFSEIGIADVEITIPITINNQTLFPNEAEIPARDLMDRLNNIVIKSNGDHRQLKVSFDPHTCYVVEF